MLIGIPVSSKERSGREGRTRHIRCIVTSGTKHYRDIWQEKPIAIINRQVAHQLADESIIRAG